MSTLVIIQALLGSTRFPSKVLEPIGDFPALFHVVMRARHALPDAEVIVASPEKDVSILSAECACDFVGVAGPEDDVLRRFAVAARLCDATTIVRLTADCPFVDVAGIRAVADAVEVEGADYAWTGDQVNGLDAEAFTTDMLARAHKHAKDGDDREHVTPWMRRHADRIYRYDGFDHLPAYRWTLDTRDDLAFLRAVAELTDVAPPDPSAERLHALIQAHPHLIRMENAA